MARKEHKQPDIRSVQERREWLRMATERRHSEHKIFLEQFLARFACVSLAGACIATFGVFYLQGFHWHGFVLDAGLMHWIGAATIGALSGLAAIVYKQTFKKL